MERSTIPDGAALGTGVPMTSAFELSINQKQPVTVNLPGLRVVITRGIFGKVRHDS